MLFSKKRLVTNTPMGSAPFVYDENGNVAWNKMWSSFCYLAREGGPPHRGDLLKTDPNTVNIHDPKFEKNLNEVIRAYKMLLPYKVEYAVSTPEVVVNLPFTKMAKWFEETILLENVFVRREKNKIFVVVSEKYELEKEIKNLVTVFAKTFHYWDLHMNVLNKISILLFGIDWQFRKPKEN